MGQCTYTSEVPPDRRGLMIDMGGSTTAASLYLDTTHAIDGVYPPALPGEPSELNQTALGNMTGMMSVASYLNALDEQSGDYWRAGWFNDGYVPGLCRLYRIDVDAERGRPGRRSPSR